jgi:hypothetical protein
MSQTLLLIGTQEILILLMVFIILVIVVPVIAYQQGKKKGRLEGKLQEMERQRGY